VAGDSNSMAAVTAYLVNLMKDNANAWGVQEVFDGPYQLIGPVPAIGVEPNRINRDWAGAAGVGTMRAKNLIQILINIYHGRLQEAAINHRQCMERSELVVAKIHEDKQLGGLVVHGWVTVEQYGIARANSGLLWTTRLDWTGESRVIV